MNSSVFTDQNPPSRFDYEKCVIVVCPEEASRTFAKQVTERKFTLGSEGLSCPYTYQIRIHPDLHHSKEDGSKKVTLLLRPLNEADWMKWSGVSELIVNSAQEYPRFEGGEIGGLRSDGHDVGDAEDNVAFEFSRETLQEDQEKDEKPDQGDDAASVWSTADTLVNESDYGY